VISGCTLDALYKKLEEGNLPPKARSVYFSWWLVVGSPPIPLESD
jgi:hypothetical protein